MNDIKAMVLAAGMGKRMRPLTAHCPKPLIEVAGRPLIAYAFDLLRESGITNATVNTHYLAEQIRMYLQDVADLTIHESYEDRLLETGGGIANALPLLGNSPFFALNSDTICISPPHRRVLSQMLAQWDDSVMDLMLLLMPREKAVGYKGAGDFVLDEAQGRFRRRRADEKGDMVFTGIQLLKPSVFRGCPDGAFSMNVIYDRYQTAPEGWFDRAGFMVHEGEWLHVGSSEEREEAQRYLSKR